LSKYGKGIPISIGGILSGNHNDLYHVVPQFAKMIKGLNACGICVQNSLLNADKGFDSKGLRRACRRRNIIPNIKENVRNRKKPKRGRKRYFHEKVYKRRFVNERAFAWLDSFKTLLVRFDKLDDSWINWHYLAFVLILNQFVYKHEDIDRIHLHIVQFGNIFSILFLSTKMVFFSLLQKYI
jgi:transposase